MAAPALSPHHKLSFATWMEIGAGVNYLHPTPEPEEFWDGGNTQEQPGLKSSLLALKIAPGVVKQQKKEENNLWRAPCTQALDEGLRFTLSRGSLCFLFFEIS